MLTNLDEFKPDLTVGVKSPPDLTIFVPSRGRPDEILHFSSQFEQTKRGNTKAVFIVDEDDHLLYRYKSQNRLGMQILVAPPTARGMNGALNWGFRHLYKKNELGFAIGFMGDDHRPRTEGWDLDYLFNLDLLKTGFVYGNDLFQGERIPTQAAFTTDIAAALGYMCPDRMQHLNIDNIWKDWGTAIERIIYLPSVIVEHMHPLAGKSKLDKNYKAVNSNYVIRADNAAYKEYHESGDFALDVQKLKMLLENGYIEPWHSRGL